LGCAGILTEGKLPPGGNKGVFQHIRGDEPIMSTGVRVLYNRDKMKEMGAWKGKREAFKRLGGQKAQILC